MEELAGRNEKKAGKKLKVFENSAGKAPNKPSRALPTPKSSKSASPRSPPGTASSGIKKHKAKVERALQKGKKHKKINKGPVKLEQEIQLRKMAGFRRMITRYVRGFLADIKANQLKNHPADGPMKVTFRKIAKLSLNGVKTFKVSNIMSAEATDPQIRKSRAVFNYLKPRWARRTENQKIPFMKVAKAIYGAIQLIHVGQRMGASFKDAKAEVLAQKICELVERSSQEAESPEDIINEIMLSLDGLPEVEGLPQEVKTLVTTLIERVNRMKEFQSIVDDRSHELEELGVTAEDEEGVEQTLEQTTEVDELKPERRSTVNTKRGSILVMAAPQAQEVGRRKTALCLADDGSGFDELRVKEARKTITDLRWAYKKLEAEQAALSDTFGSMIRLSIAKQPMAKAGFQSVEAEAEEVEANVARRRTGFLQSVDIAHSLHADLQSKFGLAGVLEEDEDEEDGSSMWSGSEDEDESEVEEDEMAALAINGTTGPARGLQMGTRHGNVRQTLISMARGSTTVMPYHPTLASKRIPRPPGHDASQAAPLSVLHQGRPSLAGRASVLAARQQGSLQIEGSLAHGHLFHQHGKSVLSSVSLQVKGGKTIEPSPQLRKRLLGTAAPDEAYSEIGTSVSPQSMGDIFAASPDSAEPALGREDQDVLQRIGDRRSSWRPVEAQHPSSRKIIVGLQEDAASLFGCSAPAQETFRRQVSPQPNRKSSASSSSTADDTAWPLHKDDTHSSRNVSTTEDALQTHLPMPSVDNGKSQAQARRRASVVNMSLTPASMPPRSSFVASAPIPASELIEAPMAPRARRGSLQASKLMKGRASVRGPLPDVEEEKDAPLEVTAATGGPVSLSAGRKGVNKDLAVNVEEVASALAGKVEAIKSRSSMISHLHHQEQAASRLANSRSPERNERFSDQETEMKWQMKLSAQAVAGLTVPSYHSEAERRIAEGHGGSQSWRTPRTPQGLPALSSTQSSSRQEELDPFEESCSIWIAATGSDIENRADLIYELREVLKMAELERSQWKLQSKLMAAKLNPGYYQQSLSASLHYRDKEVETLRRELRTLEAQQISEHRQMNIQNNRLKKRSHDQAHMRRLRETQREPPTAEIDVTPSKLLGPRIDTILDDSSPLAKAKLKRHPPKVEALGGLRSTAFTEGGTEIHLWGWEPNDYCFRDADLALAAYVLPELPVLHPRAADVEAQIVKEALEGLRPDEVNDHDAFQDPSTGYDSHSRKPRESFVQTARNALASQGTVVSSMDSRGSDKSWMERSAESWASAQETTWKQHRSRYSEASWNSSSYASDDDDAVYRSFGFMRSASLMPT